MRASARHNYSPQSIDDAPVTVSIVDHG